MRFKDLTGQRFGRLVVIKKIGLRNGHAEWECRCDCGNVVNVVGCQLTGKKTKSCGCYRRNFKVDDLSNKRFGNLTVVEMVGTNKYHNTLWKCICDCGNETVKSSHNLKTGDTTSCGCYQKMQQSKGQKKMLEKREAKKIENVYIPMLRQRKREGTTSKYKGVYYNSKENRWKAAITLKYKKIFLGTFHTEEEAYKARLIAEKILHRPFLLKEANIKKENFLIDVVGFSKEEAKQFLEDEWLQGKIEKALEIIEAS